MCISSMRRGGDSGPPPIFAGEIRAGEGSYITTAHAIGLAPGREEIKPRRRSARWRVGIFRDIEKHFRSCIGKAAERKAVRAMGA